MSYMTSKVAFDQHRSPLLYTCEMLKVKVNQKIKIFGTEFAFFLKLQRNTEFGI